jgi:hypothetical protein
VPSYYIISKVLFIGFFGTIRFGYGVIEKKNLTRAIICTIFATEKENKPLKTEYI